MKRMLVVVDGSVQANLALDRAIEIAGALANSEIVLLNIPAPPSSWQARRPFPHNRGDVAERVTARALAKTTLAGVTARVRVETGEKAEIAAKVAFEERCDHIFLPEQGPTPVARAFHTLTGFTASTAASRIISLSDVPVTVVAHEGIREKA